MNNNITNALSNRNYVSRQTGRFMIQIGDCVLAPEGRCESGELLLNSGAC